MKLGLQLPLKSYKLIRNGDSKYDWVLHPDSLNTHFMNFECILSKLQLFLK